LLARSKQGEMTLKLLLNNYAFVQVSSLMPDEPHHKIGIYEHSRKQIYYRQGHHSIGGRC